MASEVSSFQKLIAIKGLELAQFHFPILISMILN